MIRNSMLAAALLTCVPLAALAETTYVFDSVTRIQQRYSTTLITGILVNETTPTTVTIPANGGEYTERCEKLYNTVLSRPEAYTLTVSTDIVYGGPSGTSPSLVVSSCTVDVKP